MNRLLLVLVVLAVTASGAWAQPGGWKAQAKAFQPSPDPPSNFIQSIDAAGDSLWLGPRLTLYLDGADDRAQNEECAALIDQDRPCFLPVDNPAVADGDNTLFALDLPNPSTIWAGLAFDTGDGEPGSAGFLVSRDGGATFDRKPPPLDRPADTTLAYGDNRLPAVPIVEEPNTAAQDVDTNPRTGRVWAAAVRSGLRYSDDGGDTWTRAVLPPDTSAFISPDSTYDFLVSPPLRDGRGFRNHIGFSVLVDAEGVVWAGTPNGLNRSDSLYAGGSRSWRQIRYDGSPDGLTGRSVVVLAEQPLADRRNRIWIGSWAAEDDGGARQQRFGVTVTDDGGDTFRQALLGVRVGDFAFRGGTVYAAGGTDGLFVSTDAGRRWRSVTRFPLDGDPGQVLPRDLSVNTVATTTEALWVGTTDGLLRLPRGAEAELAGGAAPSWTLFRTAAPVNPDSPTDAAPDVETYAYPNPFSPADEEFVRIRFPLDESATVEVNVYDFGMNRVRTITRRATPARPEVTWDGTDEGGLRLPNGPYFYTVDTGEQTVRGKILLVE